MRGERSLREKVQPLGGGGGGAARRRGRAGTPATAGTTRVARVPGGIPPLRFPTTHRRTFSAVVVESRRRADLHPPGLRRRLGGEPSEPGPLHPGVDRGAVID